MCMEIRSTDGGGAVPNISFNLTGDIAYFATTETRPRVWACNINDIMPRDCTDDVSSGGARYWRSPELASGVNTVARTPDALVAFGYKAAYFLNYSTGELITPAASPIVPEGDLYFVAALGGADGSTYLLAVKPGEYGVKQIIIFDKPNQLVVDFRSRGNGYFVDIDSSGRAWLLAHDLIPMQTAAEYRARLLR